MSSQPPDPPIIVSGGSVTVEFDEGQLAKAGNGKHHHPDKHLERIEISGDGIDIKETFATGDVTIKIYYGYGNAKKARP